MRAQLVLDLVGLVLQGENLVTDLANFLFVAGTQGIEKAGHLAGAVDERIAGLRRPREELRARIEARVDEMFAEGLIDEVRGLELGPTAGQGVGYKEVLGHLRGEYDLAEARRLIVRNTGRLARRQETWFRRLPVRWIDAAAPDAVQQLVAYYESPTSGA